MFAPAAEVGLIADPVVAAPCQVDANSELVQLSEQPLPVRLDDQVTLFVAVAAGAGGYNHKGANPTDEQSPGRPCADFPLPHDRHRRSGWSGRRVGRDSVPHGSRVMTRSVLLDKRFLPIAAVVAMAALVGACSSGDSAPTVQTETGGIDGAVVYSTSCASCHGADLQGTDKGPSHLSTVYEPNHHTDDAFRSAIANGAPQHHWNFGAMEPIEGLSDNEVEAVIAFVRSEQERLGFEE